MLLSANQNLKKLHEELALTPRFEQRRIDPHRRNPGYNSISGSRTFIYFLFLVSLGVSSHILEVSSHIIILG